MGGNKGDRKSYKATSSAKAAEALAAKGAGTAGFGGYVTSAVATDDELTFNSKSPFVAMLLS
jgi:hypothetical protein